jgi:superfamily II DNA/RNA helicase
VHFLKGRKRFVCVWMKQFQYSNLLLQDFREGGSGRCLLVATELAARGIDVPNVSHVYNYEWPQSVTSYIHRAGRTGRRPITEECGTVTSFITPKELFVLQRVENELKLKFSSIGVPT